MSNLDDLDMGQWVYIVDRDNPLCSEPVTYLGVTEDNYVLYAEGHINILSTKPSMFTLFDPYQED